MEQDLTLPTRTWKQEHNNVEDMPLHHRTWSIASGGPESHRRTVSISAGMMDTLLSKTTSLDTCTPLCKVPSLGAQWPLRTTSGPKPSHQDGCRLDVPWPRPVWVPGPHSLFHQRNMSGPWFDVDLSG